MKKENTLMTIFKIQVYLAALCLLPGLSQRALASSGQKTTLVGAISINGVGVENAVVYLIPDDRERKAPRPIETTIVQEKTRFKPVFTVVTTGSTVYFENDDDKIHNVNSQHGPNRFDIGAHLPQTRKEVLLKSPGIVPLRCKVHEKMKAWIYVSPSSYYTLTKHDGRFEITDIPLGRYRVEAWYFNLSPSEREAGRRVIDLSKNTETIHLQFTAAMPDKDFSDVILRDWGPVVEEIKTALDQAFLQWEKKKRTAAAVRVMTAQSRLFHGSGLRNAIAKNQGEKKAEEYEQQFDRIRKSIQSIDAEAIGNDALRQEIDLLLSSIFEAHDALKTP